MEIMQTLFQIIQHKTGLNQPQIISFVVILCVAVIMVTTFDIPKD